jgi:hypothetical protein
VRSFTIILGLCLGLLLSQARAGSYPLTDGTTAVGELVTCRDEGVVIKKSDGTTQLLHWGDFTFEAIKQMHDDPSTTAAERNLMEPMLLDAPSPKGGASEIEVTPVQYPPRPTGNLGVFAILTSPMGWLILLVLYGANLFAAYEVAVFRNQPVASVCGLAAIPLFGVASPLYYLAQPSRRRPEDEYVEPNLPELSAPIALPAAGARPNPMPGIPPAAPAPAPVPAAPTPQSGLPAPVIFKKGDFSFNRRFFETKMPGFFRVVLSESDKDMVILVKSNRGDFLGKRIPRITQTELYLQVFKEEATAEEMIPFGEIMEVQLRHKDLG